MTVNFVDIPGQWAPLRDKIFEEMKEAANKGAFVGGENLKRFESSLADYVGVDHAIACNSGTAALQLILMGLGIGPGDEVILPVNTFIATYFAVQHVGATAVLVDCENQGYTIDPFLVRMAITSKTKAIMAVHLYGQCALMEELAEIADDHNLFLIEDSAQALGAQRNSKMAGSIGSAAGTSFYPAKNLGAWGEGGAVTTNDDLLAKRIKRILDQGQKEKYVHTELGHNFRLPPLQSIPLYYGLKELDGWNNSRRSAADMYRAGIEKEREGSCPVELGGNRHVYHLFEFDAGGYRDELKEYLAKKNIPVGLHYPRLICDQPIFRKRSQTSRCTGDEMFFKARPVVRKLLSLPMHPLMSKGDVNEVCDAIKDFYDNL